MFGWMCRWFMLLLMRALGWIFLRDPLAGLLQVISWLSCMHVQVNESAMGIQDFRVAGLYEQRLKLTA